MGSVSASEEEFKRHLNHSWTNIRLDLSEGCRLYVADRQTEVRVIQEVEKFAAKLQLFGFGQADVLDCREVPVDISRAEHSVAPFISEHLKLSLRVRL